MLACLHTQKASSRCLSAACPVHRPAAKLARLEGSYEDREALVDAILRYYYYVELGVDAYKHVAPFREEWAGNALSMVSRDVDL